MENRSKIPRFLVNTLKLGQKIFFIFACFTLFKQQLDSYIIRSYFIVWATCSLAT